MNKRIAILSIFLLIFSIYPNYKPMADTDKKNILATFSTSVTDQTANVKTNIAIATGKINGVVITPGEVFSFNQTVGEGSAQNGFVDGGVLYRDRVVLEPGGGLCQVSSTLFNAFLLSGIKIIERHRHYQPVTYVPLGLDATIKYGKKDLRMKNPYKFNIYIEAGMNNQSLYIKILGDGKIPYNYTIDTEEDILTVPLAKEPERIRPGMNIYVYRKKFRGKKFIENFLLYRDFYPPVIAR